MVDADMDHRGRSVSGSLADRAPWLSGRSGIAATVAARLKSRGAPTGQVHQRIGRQGLRRLVQTGAPCFAS